MILNDAYEDLRRHGFVESHVEFSERWLNKSPRYMSMLRASGRAPSVDTLARLLYNLKFHHDTFERSSVNVLQERAALIKPTLNKLNKTLLETAGERNVWLNKR